YRDHHGDSKRYHMRFEQSPVSDIACSGSSIGTTGLKGIDIIPYGLERTIRIIINGESFIPYRDCWFEGMRYHMEEERGLSSYEDHYIPGCFESEIAANSEKIISVVCTMEKMTDYPDIEAVFRNEEERIRELEKTAFGAGRGDAFAAMLVKAADDFIVYRQSTGTKTIIAGYPWFSDWGRDSMIALPGLTLSTGRISDAEDILKTFSRYVRYGLVPNMFPEGGEEPLYNSVDAALWYMEAIGGYHRKTGNTDFIKQTLYPSMKQVIEGFMKGTINGIHTAADGLVSAGDEGLQLTWMDAKVGDWVVTPRHGKAVEINALWYSALKLMEELETAFCNHDEAAFYKLEAIRVKTAFEAEFWNEADGCLYDVIKEGFKDNSMRPNQIFAVSLLHPVIEGEKAKKVVDKVWKELYTPLGLRTLSPSSPGYRGTYSGNQYERDGAYHQGTVWAWLIGPFVTAFTRVHGREGQYGRLAESFIEPFRDHLGDACIGSISEIFSGNEPHEPKGCFAQAWSVA
ncbi:MAG: glycogen debranching protein, partial [Clostridiales bacterium]|nr:glycogen debranching protein [Clostridiales bacterium]